MKELARPGLSYVDAQSGRIVEIQGDVLDVKTQIRERWPNINVYWDNQEKQWIFTQICEDGTERLFMKRKELDSRCVEAVAAADPSSRTYEDPIDAIDKHNAEVERDRDRRFENQMGDVGERFLHALRKDGVMDHPDIYGTRLKNRRR